MQLLCFLICSLLFILSVFKILWFIYLKVRKREWDCSVPKQLQCYRNQVLHLGFPHGCQQRKRLGHFLLLSQISSRAARTQTSTPVWCSCFTSMSLNCCTTVPTPPALFFLPKITVAVQDVLWFHAYFCSFF